MLLTVGDDVQFSLVLHFGDQRLPNIFALVYDGYGDTPNTDLSVIASAN